MISCVRMQPGRIDKLEPATGPPDYKPRSRSRMAEVVSTTVNSNLPLESPSTSGAVLYPSQQFFTSETSQYSSSPWRNLLNSYDGDEGLGAAIAGHKRLRADVDELMIPTSYHHGSSVANRSDPNVIANLARDMEIQARASEVVTLSWPPAASSHSPLGEVVTKATESRSSPGAAGYSSSPSWISSCSSDSGIQHSDICCKPYFSPPRNNPGNHPREPSPSMIAVFNYGSGVIESHAPFRYTVAVVVHSLLRKIINCRRRSPPHRNHGE